MVKIGARQHLARGERACSAGGEYATISSPKVTATVKVSVMPAPSSSSPRDEPAGAIQATAVVTTSSAMNSPTTNEPTSALTKSFCRRKGRFGTS